MIIFYDFLLRRKTNLTAVLEEPVDVDDDGKDKNGDGDHCGCVPWELVVRPRMSFLFLF